MYAVIELQKSSDTQLATLATTHPNINDAYNKWHNVLAYAAVSTLPIHGAVILSETGDVIATEYFAHAVEEGES